MKRALAERQPMGVREAWNRVEAWKRPVEARIQDAAALEHAFESMYGSPPQWIACAPGRVNLIGEHTDYNDGFVMPMAIERHTMIAAAPNESNGIVVRSTAYDDSVCITLDDVLEPSPRGVWVNYLKGVVAGFQRLGHRIPGLNVLIDSNVPMGGGLSSSAALEVATATLLEAITDAPLMHAQKPLLCQRAEHEFAGTPCGIMDQFVSTLARRGAFLMLDCRQLQTQWIQVDDPSVAVLIFDTRIKHQHSAGDYATRRGECQRAAERLGVPNLREATLLQLEALKEAEPTLHRRARHVITENERVISAASRIRGREWEVLGELMYASHESLRGDFEVSCAELDTVVRIAQEIGIAGGVYGCRMTGGGFGGCAVAVIDAGRQDEIQRRMTGAYLARTGIESALFVSRPADGAQVLKG